MVMRSSSGRKIKANKERGKKKLPPLTVPTFVPSAAHTLTHPKVLKSPPPTSQREWGPEPSAALPRPFHSTSTSMCGPGRQTHLDQLHHMTAQSGLASRAYRSLLSHKLLQRPQASKHPEGPKGPKVGKRPNMRPQLVRRGHPGTLFAGGTFTRQCRVYVCTLATSAKQCMSYIHACTDTHNRFIKGKYLHPWAVHPQQHWARPHPAGRARGRGW